MQSGLGVQGSWAWCVIISRQQIPNHTYLLLKMPAPKGVLSVYGDLQTSYACEAKNIKLSDTLERSRYSVLVAQAAKNLLADQQ